MSRPLLVAVRVARPGAISLWWTVAALTTALALAGGASDAGRDHRLRDQQHRPAPLVVSMPETIDAPIYQSHHAGGTPLHKHAWELHPHAGSGGRPWAGRHALAPPPPPPPPLPLEGVEKGDGKPSLRIQARSVAAKAAVAASSSEATTVDKTHPSPAKPHGVGVAAEVAVMQVDSIDGHGETTRLKVSSVKPSQPQLVPNHGDDVASLKLSPPVTAIPSVFGESHSDDKPPSAAQWKSPVSSLSISSPSIVSASPTRTTVSGPPSSCSHVSIVCPDGSVRRGSVDARTGACLAPSCPPPSTAGAGKGWEGINGGGLDAIETAAARELESLSPVAAAEVQQLLKRAQYYASDAVENAPVSDGAKATLLSALGVANQGPSGASSGGKLGWTGLSSSGSAGG